MVVGRVMVFQDWLKRVSCDILNKADYTLAFRTYLTYPLA